MAKWYGYNIESFQQQFKHNVTVDGTFTLTGILAYGSATDRFLVVDDNGIVGTRNAANILQEIEIPDASTTVKGLANFASSDFTVESGAVSLIDLTASHIAAGTLVTESEGIASNDNDTTLPTSAAVKDYVDRPNKFVNIIHSAFRDDIGTDLHYIPLQSTSEKTTNTNEEIPFVAPYDGKLLQLHYRTSKNTSGATATFTLIQIEKTENVSTARNTTLDTQTTAGPENTNGGSNNLRVVNFDADAAFNAGDMLAISIQHDSAVTDSNTKFYITTIFEYNISTLT